MKSLYYLQKKSKKKGTILLVLCFTIFTLVGCSFKADKIFNPNSEIILVSREDGSGTRGAFVDLFDLTATAPNGSKMDTTSLEAIITNNTSVVMTTVSGNLDAIGYISLGSVNETIKPLEIDGVAPTIETVKNDTYKVKRPFIIVTKDEISEATQDFLNFIFSEQGQAIVEKAGYISEGNTGPYKSNNTTVKVSVAGSSSVSPLMEKLKEGYIIANPNANIEIQQSDSTVGITSTAEGICDIGMASRTLKESEESKGLEAKTIAIDAICLIVNTENPILGLTTEQVNQIYSGKITNWIDVE